VDRAISLLNRQMAAPPALPTTLIDGVVLVAARELWEAGKYRQAVSDAATAVNKSAQEVLGRHDS
jgi:hypothetical protein